MQTKATKKKKEKEREKRAVGSPNGYDVNIARVNRLIGQPMAEASLSSSPCIVGHFSRVVVLQHVCTDIGRTRGEGISSTFVIVNRDAAYFTAFLPFDEEKLINVQRGKLVEIRFRFECLDIYQVVHCDY